MRYYTVRRPGQTAEDETVTTNARALRDLPNGTEVWAVITDRDGSLADTYQIPVANGRVLIARRGTQRPRLAR